MTKHLQLYSALTTRGCSVALHRTSTTNGILFLPQASPSLLYYIPRDSYNKWSRFIKTSSYQVKIYTILSNTYSNYKQRSNTSNNHKNQYNNSNNNKQLYNNSKNHRQSFNNLICLQRKPNIHKYTLKCSLLSSTLFSLTFFINLNIRKSHIPINKLFCREAHELVAKPSHSTKPILQSWKA